MVTKQQLITVLLILLGWAAGEVYGSIVDRLDMQQEVINNHQESIEGLIDLHLEIE